MNKNNRDSNMVSIIVPMFNEEKVISSTVSQLKDTLNSLPESWEVLLVDDGSTDKTAAIAKDLAENDDRIHLFSYSPNVGRGKALRVGFENARGKFIVSNDADLSYHPKYILDIIRVLREEPNVDVVIGSPYTKGGSTEGIPFLRLLISKIGNKIISFALPGNLSTVTSIFRGYRCEALETMEFESDGKEIHLEILSKALELGYKVKEIPVVLKGRTKGKSKFKFRSTATSHILFSFFEKPMMLFGLLGLFFIFGGLACGIYVTYLRFEGMLNPQRPLMYLTVLLVLAGIQMLSFGFISIQMRNLRSEIYKVRKENKQLQRQIKKKG